MQADKTIFYICVTLIAISIVFSLSLPVFTVLFFKAMVYLGFGLFFSCLVAMGAMHALPSSLVTDAGGAKRWIRLPGFSLAPVEFFKIGFVYFLAWSFARKIDDSKKSLKEEFKLIFPYMCVFLIVVYLIAVLQNDLGQVVVLALTLIMMALFAGTSIRLFRKASQMLYA